LQEERVPLIPVTQNLFRREWHPEASRAFISSSDGGMVYTSSGLYFERKGVWTVYAYRILVFGAVIVMMSCVAYSLFWVPVHIFKRIKRKENHSAYLSMRVVPLLAVLSLILGTLKMGDQSILEFGMFTMPNVIFFVSTLVFVGLSTLSLFTTWRSFFKPVKTAARAYAVLLSSACFGMTIYLTYWGVIGLRLWAY
jgi:hypothetical protein